VSRFIEDTEVQGSIGNLDATLMVTHVEISDTIVSCRTLPEANPSNCVSGVTMMMGLTTDKLGHLSKLGQIKHATVPFVINVPHKNRPLHMTLGESWSNVRGEIVCGTRANNVSIVPTLRDESAHPQE
jgi:hypothetical protein